MKRLRVLLSCCVVLATILFIPTVIRAQTYQEVSSWGGPGGGGGTFNWPMGITTDRNANVYVADVINSRVQKFSSSGDFLSMWGKKGYSPGDFQMPLGVAADSAGNVYVTDRDLSYVQKFSSEGTYLGSLPVHGSGVAVGKDGFIYVVGDTITKMQPDGTVLSRFGSSGTSIAVDDSGFVYGVLQKQIAVGQDSLVINRFGRDGVLVNNWSLGPLCCRHSPIHFGIAVDSAKYVYVGLPYHDAKIFKYTTSGVLLDQITCVESPRGITIAPSGNLLVTSSSEYKVQALSKQGAILFSWGQFGGMGDGHFNFPHGIAIDTARASIYVADFWDCRVQRFSLDGAFQAKWGTNGTLVGQLTHPEGIAVDRNGNVYVNDAGMCRVQKFDSSGMFIRTWGQSGSGQGQFSRNSAIAVDKDNFVYVTDLNDRVQKFTSDGLFVLEWGTTGNGDGQFMVPRGIGVDNQGFVYVVDHGTVNEKSRVQKFTSSGVFLTKWDLGTNQFDGAPRLAGISFDKFGNVFIVDDGAKKVYKFTSNGLLLSGWDLEWPSGIGVDAKGHIYVVSGWHGDQRMHKYQALMPTLSHRVDFGQAGKGDSTLSTLIVNNPYSNPLMIYALSTSSANFSTSQSLPAMIAAGDSLTITLWFKPKTFGSIVDTLNVVMDGGTGKVALMGTAPYPVFTSSKSSIDLGNAARNSTVSQTLVIKNSSLSPLCLDSIYTLTRWFKPTLSKGTVGKEDSLVLRVSFSPDSIRSYSDTLFIRNNSLTGTVKIPLSGDSPEPVLISSKSSILFGDITKGTLASQSVVLKDSSVNILSIDSAYTLTRWFWSSLGKATITNADSLFAVVFFKPDSIRNYADTLIILNNSANRVVRIPLSGNSPPAALAVPSSALSFPPAAVGDSVFSILLVYNRSINSLTLTSVSTQTDVFRPAIQVPTTIGVIDSLALKVFFKPKMFGESLDMLSISSDGGTAKLALIGTSPPPFLKLSKSSLDFEVLTKDSTRRITVAIMDTSVNALRIDSLYTHTKYFKVPSVALPLFVKKSDTLDLIVRFTPDSSRLYVDTLFIRNNSLTSLVTVPLMGQGTNTITHVAELGIPAEFKLHQSYPNPFNPSTTIQYDLPLPGHVTLVVYNVLGQVVTKLIDDQQGPGIYKAIWEASNVPSGIYFYRLQAGEFVETKKMILLR